MDKQAVLAKQQAFFAGGKTRALDFRLQALRRLRLEIQRRKQAIVEALYSDLGKAPMESYMTEIGLVLEEISYLEKRLPGWVANSPVPTPLTHFPSVSYVQHDPYGVVLIMAPWNYPLQLSLVPLVGAIAAGNCAVVKPSAYAPATSAMVRQLAESCFAPNHVQVIEGGRAENAELLELDFDYIFFTGSVAVGKLVMEKAARRLTPVSLELGGKSPVIVDQTADIKLAGRRIAFGKFLNAGQTCIAPDYVLVHESVEEPLLRSLQLATRQFFGERPLDNTDLPKIVNQKHFDRLKGLLAGQQVAFGGENDGLCRIAPTVLRDVSPDAPVMQEEIFGPILPVIRYKTLAEAVAFVNRRPRPLALYLFTRSGVAKRQVLRRCRFGGGCVNDTIVHIATSEMGFGGVGGSGMGSYHGKKSFETFTHDKSLLEKSNLLDLPVRYHPYKPWKQKLLEALMR